MSFKKSPSTEKFERRWKQTQMQKDKLLAEKSPNPATVNAVDPLDRAFEKRWSDAEKAKAKLHAKAVDHKQLGLIARVWAKLKKRFPCPVDLYVGGTFFLHLAVYWGTGIAYLIFEKLIASKGFLARYKIQPNKSVTGAEITKLLKAVLTNHAVLTVGFLILRRLKDSVSGLKEHFQEMVDRPIPSIKRIGTEYLFNLGVFEVIFYMLHYTLHRPKWYKQIHKQVNASACLRLTLVAHHCLYRASLPLASLVSASFGVVPLTSSSCVLCSTTNSKPPSLSPRSTLTPSSFCSPISSLGRLALF